MIYIRKDTENVVAQAWRNIFVIVPILVIVCCGWPDTYCQFFAIVEGPLYPLLFVCTLDGEIEPPAFYLACPPALYNTGAQADASQCPSWVYS